MSDIERRGWAVAGRAVANALGPGVAALCAVVGLPPLGATALGALAGSLTEEGMAIVAQSRLDRVGRVQHFAEVAEEAAKSPIGGLLAEASQRPAKLELLVQAVEGATQSLGDWKIEMLARLFVAGMRDEAKVDEALVLVHAVRQLEVPHLRVLAVLSRQAPSHIGERSTGPWVIPERRVWLVGDIAAEDPGVEGAFDVLIARLQGLGLVSDERVGAVDFEPHWTLTAFGWQCVEYLTDRGSQG
ncbi:hypothetical protein [Micromonospora viridifaciens]|nr:hypothetical protein [Micromonospora viridifaciens]